MKGTIRTLFSTEKPIDRPIEKVIDYHRDDDKWLSQEVEEYEVTENVESCFRKFIENYGAGVRAGDATQVGIWVSGFYGSGKSSFTKYLGFALDPKRNIRGIPFLDLLCDRFRSNEIKSELKTLVRKEPTAVVMLDLGSEQLADTATAPVTLVLYWKVLQWAGFSREKKIAELEFKLDEQGQYEQFQAAYREKFPGKGEWRDIHNDPLIGVARADHLVPQFLPEFRPGDFRSLKFEMAIDVRMLAERMIALAQKTSGHRNVMFLIDEAGQYVAPRGELILNLDGLARNLKELGKGRVWIVATGQQTLAEIVEQAAYNSSELNKLKDRFPISITLDPRDIREITYLRLLKKSDGAQRDLALLFDKQGPLVVASTAIVGWSLYKSELDRDSFVRFYPFLPQHFDLLMELIRTLAASTGGIGLRSAIRVIQDLLVDASRSLAAGQRPLAGRPIGTLAAADDFFDILRADIGKVLPHVLSGIEKVERIFSGDQTTLRVAKAIAGLQPLQEHFPRTEENLAALLYPSVGAPSQLPAVRDALAKLTSERECGLVNDPLTGYYGFLSEGVKVYRDKRNDYTPASGEINRLRSQLLTRIFDPLPAAKLENVKNVKAGIRYQKVPVAGDENEIQIRIEPTASQDFLARREQLLVETNSNREFDNTIALLTSFPAELDELLIEARRSDFIVSTIPERDADKDVAQFLRSERTLLGRSQDRARKLIERTLHDEGIFIFQASPLPVKEAGDTLEAACRAMVGSAAKKIFSKFRLLPIQVNTDLATKFLEVERLDRMPADVDPLQFVGKTSGRTAIQVKKDALVEAVGAFREMASESGAGRIQGKAIQDRLYSPPYGWQKDATRYAFAALFRAGEVQLHTGDGTVTTPGPQAIEAFKSTASFNRVGLSVRNSRPPLDAMDRAARRLEELFAIEVLPLEEHISRAVRTNIPTVIENVGALPDRLRLLDLRGFERAQLLLQTCADLLKEDASGAATVLGASECSLPSDIRWADAVRKALADDGEDLIRETRNILSSISDLEELFPGEGASLLSGQQRETIDSTLASETFFERIPDLRSALRSIKENLAAKYQALRHRLQDEQVAARNALEGLAKWLELTPDDRKDIASRLTVADVPAEPRSRRELADLRLLLTRLNGLATLTDSLRVEVAKRIPKTKPEPESQPEGENPTVLRVAARQLRPPGAIASEQDLNDWINELRTRFLALLNEYSEIRFEE